MKAMTISVILSRFALVSFRSYFRAECLRSLHPSTLSHLRTRAANVEDTTDDEYEAGHVGYAKRLSNDASASQTVEEDDNAVSVEKCGCEVSRTSNSSANNRRMPRQRFHAAGAATAVPAATKLASAVTVSL